LNKRASAEAQSVLGNCPDWDVVDVEKGRIVAESPFDATWAQPAITGNRISIKDATRLTLWTID
jgi:hypothetical protein